MSLTPTAVPSAPATRYAGRVGICLLVVFGGVLPYLVLFLLVSQNWQPLIDLDNSVELDAHRAALASPLLRRAAFAATFLGGGAVRAALTLVVAGALYATRRPRLAIFLVVTVGAGGLLNVLLKLAVSRARPLFSDAIAVESSTSFPSGHTMGATVLVTSLLLLAWPALSRLARPPSAVLAILAVTAVAASRVLLGVHYLSDVVAAFFAGIVWVAVSTLAFLGWRADRGRRAKVLRSRGAGGGPGPPTPAS